MSDPTSRYPEQPQNPEQQPAYVPPPGYEEYAPRQQAPYAGQQQPYQQGPQQPYQQGYSQPYQQGYQGAPVRPTSVVAVIGLVLAFLLSPIGVVVSAFGIADTRGGRKAGRGLAIAGVVVGALGTVLWVLAIVAAVVFVQRSVETVSGLSTAFPSGLPSELPSGLPTDLGGVLGGEDASADVVVDSCSSTVGGVATGSVSVTNSTDADASYVVTLVALNASGEEVGDLYAAVGPVSAGQSAEGQAAGFVDGDQDVASCEVSAAVRSAAG
ncbi:FxLYD domain-containing protein [Quadrisphaera setariae]|uniref:DUF4190 domain-containing protein n=1 Tax=Quadrisphaera setariae TaxID=2593304 RepID=A0A5C8ZE47_9ACTN|nr:FxLYD domain-containing protein [Quadrisphaera setariae]TXR55569.1 DUF4190 domain-containing protein [Quadrisphaera setariae]